MITTKDFGATVNGEKVTLLRITNSKGSYVELLDFGCIVRVISVPGRDGQPVDVVLGYDSVAGYEEHHGNYFGAAIGRHANRIAKGRFTLGGKEYTLALNNGENHLHGGTKGFDSYVWDYKQLSGDSVLFSRTSLDGEENYPGNLKVEITYTFDDSDTLSIEYNAVSDADTVINLTNHSYFNLGGSGDVKDHLLQINADCFAENDSGCLPTGKITPVEGTPFDFRKPKAIGSDIDSDYPQVAIFGGYDHNFVLNGSGWRSISHMCSPKTGVAMETFTTKPGVQLYTSCALAQHTGKGGKPYGRYSAACLETQFFPNAMECTNFPSPVLKAGEQYNHKTAYRFYIY